MAGLAGEGSLYDAMNAMAVIFADQTGESNLTVNTLFSGSRSDPFTRGSIQNISEDNFTPANLIGGFLNGIAQELYNLYLPLGKRDNANLKRLIGGGNGVRKNGPLRRILAEKFQVPLEVPLYHEEAAYGAALFALTCTGYFKNVFQAQRLVRYME